MRFFLVLCVGGAAALSSLTAAQPAVAQIASGYTITNLGTLGGLTSFANAINNAGQITGNSQTPTGQPAPRLNAYLYQNGAMQNIGVLPGSNNFSRGYAINDSGAIVGESDNNSSRAFLYQNGTMTALGGLTGPNGSGVARGINNDGTIVGVSSNGSAARAFILTPGTNGVMRDLGSLDGLTTTGARALSISNSGFVTGYSAANVNGTTVSHAFLFRDLNNNNVTDPGELIDLSPGGTRFSEGLAVNDFGMVAGDATTGFTGSGTPISRPYVWSGTTATELSTLGFTFGTANGINNLGVAVGGLTNVSGLPQRAFAWTTGTGTVDLNALLINPAGWTLTSAQAINAQGQIVGYGSFNGNNTAFLLTPNVTGSAAPEPSTLFLFGMGLITGAGIAGRVKRRKAEPVTRA